MSNDCDISSTQRCFDLQQQCSIETEAANDFVNTETGAICSSQAQTPNQDDSGDFKSFYRCDFEGSMQISGYAFDLLAKRVLKEAGDRGLDKRNLPNLANSLALGLREFICFGNKISSDDSYELANRFIAATKDAKNANADEINWIFQEVALRARWKHGFRDEFELPLVYQYPAKHLSHGLTPLKVTFDPMWFGSHNRFEQIKVIPIFGPFIHLDFRMLESKDFWGKVGCCEMGIRDFFSSDQIKREAASSNFPAIPQKKP